ncbi:phasin family protein [Massilia niabensis]|uniref:Phasin family protein n=1 Tax=Massilia niabensis TaxID=544910 RepID=A0ABW0L3H5_9BURK
MQASPPNSPALHAQLETQVNFLTQLSRHTFDALGQLGTLNMQAARQLIDDSMELGRALAACKDPFQVIPVTMRVTQPATEHWRAWQSDVMRVLASSSAALANNANDGGWQAARGAAGAMDRADQYGAAHSAT